MRCGARWLWKCLCKIGKWAYRRKLQVLFELILSPLLLGFVIFLIFPHLQTSFNTGWGDHHSYYGLYQEFKRDIMKNWLPYALFLAILVAWFVVGILRIRHEEKQADKDRAQLASAIQEIMQPVVDRNTEAFNRLAQTLDRLDGGRHDGEHKPD